MVQASILGATKGVLDKPRASRQVELTNHHKAGTSRAAAPVSLRRFTTTGLRWASTDELRSGRQGQRRFALVPGLTGAAAGDVGGHVTLPVVLVEGPQPGGWVAVAGAATGLGRPGPK